MDVSIILPCYNELEALKSTVPAIQRVMDSTIYEYELIIAEDSSTDGTAELAKKLAEENDNIVWVHRSDVRGRGLALTNALRLSRGRIAGFIDVDLETPAHYIYPAILEIESGADIATCIRVYKLNRYHFIYRLPKVLSHYCYLWISSHLLGMDRFDNEAGFKFFNRGRILPILDEVKDTHWFWDTEIMVRSYRLNYKISTLPMLFLPDHLRKSKTNLLFDSVSQLIKLFKFRKELKNEKTED